MNSTFLKELYEKTEGFPMIEERFLELDLPTKNLLEKDSLKEEIVNAMDSINLTKDYYTSVAQNIAFYLLQIMEPKDLREELSRDLPNVRKEVVDALVEKIYNIIVGKEIVTIIEKNWQEDDQEAMEVAEEMELSLVPTPPGKIKNEEEVKPTTPIPAESQSTEAKTESGAPTWEEKLKASEASSPTVETRSQNDRTLPKISSKDLDPYREMPNE